MEAEPRHQPNRAEQSLVLRRNAERRPAKRMGNMTEWKDAGRVRMARENRDNHAQLVNAPLKLRERAQKKRTSTAWTQRRDAEWTWAND